MSIVTKNYESNIVEVSAAVITEENIGEVIQTLYDNEASNITLVSYDTNPLNSERNTHMTAMSVMIRGELYYATIGDYLMSREVFVGFDEEDEPIVEIHWSLLSKEVFETVYHEVV